MNQESLGENLDEFCESLVKVIQNQETEERWISRRTLKMGEAIEKKKREINELETEKAKIDGEVMTLKFRDKAFQKEHLKLRNGITVIKYQIERIKESIEKTKKSELDDLREFERAVNEITEKFRESPAIYDRQALSRKLEEEKRRKEVLLNKIREVRELYANFNEERGLRERRSADEDLGSCILPGSKLHSLMEMTKNLDVVVRDLKNHTKNLYQKELELKEVEDSVNSISSKIATLKINPETDENAYPAPKNAMKENVVAGKVEELEESCKN